MHAWEEAWLPELGWVGFDPTNNTIAAERHIRVAVGHRLRRCAADRAGYSKGTEFQRTQRRGAGVSGWHRAAHAAAVDPRAELVERPGRGWDWAQAQSAQQ